MRFWKEEKLGQYFAVILATVFSYLLCRILKISGQPESIQWFLFACLGLVSVRMVWKWRKYRANEEILVREILIMGILMRIGYMLYTGCEVRSHDMFEIDVNGAGHAGYLLQVMTKGRLPESNFRQCYQQPFFYFLGSLFSGGINTLLSCRDSYFLVDAAKTVSCSASCISLLLCRSISMECGLRGKGELTAVTLTAFLPAFYLTGGRVTPDALAAMFMLLEFLYTIRWIKEPGWKHTVLLAIIYGCGVMTKISCSVIAILTAAVFLKKLYDALRKKAGDFKLLLGKYVVFGLISLPLGLWYSVRNYIRFHQDFQYVPRISETSELYTGMHSITERFWGIDVSSLFQTPYVNIWEDYNAPVYYLKSSCFGEFTYQVPGWIPALLLFSAFGIAVACGAALLWQIRQKNGEWTGYLCAGIFLIFYVSMLVFYQKYPFACSMDFRYMIFMVVPAGILLGKYAEAHQQRCGWINTGLFLFAVSSCLMYGTI